MPNHVTNKLEISGPLAILLTIQEAIKWKNDKGEEQTFSFNAFIPMPGCLTHTISGSWVGEAIWLLDEGLYKKIKEEGKPFRNLFYSQLEPLASLSGSMRSSEPFQTKEEALTWCQENRPEILKNGEAAIRAHKETGYVDWYEWSVSHWGTKWDAYSVDVVLDPVNERLTIVFDTAWSHPLPVIDKLSRTFPNVRIVHSYFDEGHGFWGVDTYEDGTCVLCQDSEKQDYRRLCLELKGYDPNEDHKEE